MLDLSVPAVDPALRQLVETRPRTVADWLQRLPFGSPIDTTQQLAAALHALNRHALGGSERAALLALYRPVVQQAAASLEALLADAGVPPHAQQQQFSALLHDLRSEHSIGYKHVLRDLAQRRFDLGGPKRSAEAVAHLLTALGDQLAAAYLTYAPPPAGLWQDMHRLHAYAEAAHLANDTVGDAPSPSFAYRHALLLALADPPHMSHAEFVHTRLYLDRFAGLAQLLDAPVSGHRGFAVRTDDDVPPSHLAGGPAAGERWLDTDALCDHLHDTAARLRSGETPRGIGLPPGMEGELSLSLCKRLLRQWSGEMQRTFKRHAAPGTTVQAVAGVSAIHRLLEQLPQASGSDPDEEDSLPIHDVGLASAAPGVAHVTLWTVRNDSATGLALHGTPDAPLNLKVGDPLALRADDEAAWSLGVIRWIRMRDARQVELGVERLSPQVRPVWVRPLRGRRRASPEPALFIPGLAALKQNDRLLLPRHVYQIGMDAELWQPSNRSTLTFGRRVEHTPSFDVIDFTVFSDEHP
jgi:hypothetical protein